MCIYFEAYSRLNFNEHVSNRYFCVDESDEDCHLWRDICLKLKVSKCMEIFSEEFYHLNV